MTTSDSPGGLSAEDVARLPHRPLSIAHSVRMALARDRGQLVAASVPAVIVVADATVGLDRLIPSDPGIADARRVTHDQVIALAGEARLTGVVWHVHLGKDGLDLLDATTADLNDPAWLPVQHQMRQLLETEPNAVLIVASVLVDERRYRAGLS